MLKWADGEFTQSRAEQRKGREGKGDETITYWTFFASTFAVPDVMLMPATCARTHTRSRYLTVRRNVERR
jgi:hypothetical protein